MKKYRYNKYNVKKTMIDNHFFDSQKEAYRYKDLKLLASKGEVLNLELQPKFLLQEGFVKSDINYRPIFYIADFKYSLPNGMIVVEDVKGYMTQEFRLKQKLFEHKYPDLTITLI